MESLLTWYRDILIYKSCGEKGKIIFEDNKKHIREQAQLFSYESIEKVLKELDGISGKLRINVNFDMVMELLLLTMRDGLSRQGESV